MTRKAFAHNPTAGSAALGLKYALASFVAVKEAEGRKVFTFRWTDDSEDRDGEVLTQDGWILDHYHRNPVVLDCHPEIRGWEQGIKSILGQAIPPLRHVNDGWEVDIVFSQGEQGRLAEQLVEEGSLRAVSAGYMPLLKERVRGQPTKVTKKELWEISMAPIPSNRNALRVAAAGMDEEREERPIPTKAIDFNQSMAQTDLSERKWEMNRALHESLESILADKELDYDAKMAMAEQTCAQFHAAMMTVFRTALGPKPVTPAVASTTEEPDTKAGARLSQATKTEMEAACNEMKACMDSAQKAYDRIAKMMMPPEMPEEDAASTEGRAASMEATPEAPEPETPTQDVSDPDSKALQGLADAASAFAALWKKE